METISVNATASIALPSYMNRTTTGTLSWEAPTLPNNSTIESIIVTGSWSLSGYGTIRSMKINGTTVAANTPFSVNLGVSAESPATITCSINNYGYVYGTLNWSDLLVTYTYTITTTTTSYNVSAQQSEFGEIQLSASGLVEEGTTVTITVIPIDGYELENIYINGVIQDSNVFTVTGDAIVTASFIKINDTTTLGLRQKKDGRWIKFIKAFKKISGVWVIQNDIESLLDPDTKYIDCTNK